MLPGMTSLSHCLLWQDMLRPYKTVAREAMSSHPNTTELNLHPDALKQRAQSTLRAHGWETDKHAEWVAHFVLHLTCVPTVQPRNPVQRTEHGNINNHSIRLLNMSHWARLKSAARHGAVNYPRGS